MGNTHLQLLLAFFNETNFDDLKIVKIYRKIAINSLFNDNLQKI